MSAPVQKYLVDENNFGKVVWQVITVGGGIMLLNRFSPKQSNRDAKYWLMFSGVVLIGMWLGVTIYDHVWTTLKTWLNDFIPFLDL